MNHECGLIIPDRLPQVVRPPPADTPRNIEIHIGGFRVMISLVGKLFEEIQGRAGEYSSRP